MYSDERVLGRERRLGWIRLDLSFSCPLFLFIRVRMLIESNGGVHGWMYGLMDRWLRFVSEQILEDLDCLFEIPGPHVFGLEDSGDLSRRFLAVDACA